jgi:putative acetyltransferase
MLQTLPHGVNIFDETPEDIAGVRNVNRLAFNGTYESDVVDHLRDNCPEILSLVAKRDAVVVGHILFSPAHIAQPDGETLTGMGLAPLAVLPEYQGLGIGSGLCTEGLNRLKADGCPYVIVLGHPDYYPRFGFVKASKHGISSSLTGVPDEAFMIRIFKPDFLQGAQGIAYYRPEFDETS